MAEARSAPGPFEQPVDRFSNRGGPGKAERQLLQTLLRTNSDDELARMFPSVKSAEWAALRQRLQLGKPF